MRRWNSTHSWISALHAAVVRAGLTYTMTRSIRDQPDARGAMRTMAELARAVAGGLTRHVVPLRGDTAPLAESFAELGDGFAAAAEAARAAPRTS